MAGRGYGTSCVALVAAVATVLVLASAARATVVTYFGPSGTATYGVAHKSGWNYPLKNRVYRPVGTYFSLWYTDDSTAWGFIRNYWDNPLVWPYSGGYAKSVCSHSDNVLTDPVYPTTCQYIW